MLCEKLFASEKLHPSNKVFWIESFKLIKRIIHHVDYKGVREILKACRERAHNFSMSLAIADLNQFAILEELVEYIFDRDKCLLPAYFIANEVLKSGSYHWVSEFEQYCIKITFIYNNYSNPTFISTLHRN